MKTITDWERFKKRTSRLWTGSILIGIAIGGWLPVSGNSNEWLIGCALVGGFLVFAGWQG